MFSTMSKRLKEKFIPSSPAQGPDEKRTNTEGVTAGSTEGAAADATENAAAISEPDDKITAIASSSSAEDRPRKSRSATHPTSGRDGTPEGGEEGLMEGGEEEGDTDGKSPGDRQLSPDDITSARGVARWPRRSRRTSNQPASRSDGPRDSCVEGTDGEGEGGQGEGVVNGSPRELVTSVGGNVRRKSPRIREMDTSAKSENVPAVASSSATASRSDVTRSSTGKRKVDELEQEEEPDPSDKPTYEVATMLGDGWTRGSFTYKKGSKPRMSWISPIRKIEFKYRKDALLFEALCQTNGKDEVKAWSEVCNMSRF